MKLKFKNQDFQTDAINAVADLFTGQDKRQSTFAVEQDAQMNLLQNDFGIGNALLIDLVNNTPKAQEAIESLNPLSVLRYSATHREKINLLYPPDTGGRLPDGVGKANLCIQQHHREWL